MRKVIKTIVILALTITFIVIPQKAFAKKLDLNKTSEFWESSEEYLNPIHGNHSIPKPGGTTGTGGTTQSTQQNTDISNWDIGMTNNIPEEVFSFAGFIIRFLRNISIILTALVITILGIKYMIGSVQEKADYKKSYISIIIGVALITMITSIVDVIFSAAQN